MYYEKSTTWEIKYKEKVQHEMSATWKRAIWRVQNWKKFNIKKLQYEKSVITRGDMQKKKGATWKEPNLKKGAT